MHFKFCFGSAAHISACISVSWMKSSGGTAVLAKLLNTSDAELDADVIIRVARFFAQEVCHSSLGLFMILPDGEAHTQSTDSRSR